MTDSPHSSFVEAVRDALAGALSSSEVAVESVERVGAGQAGSVQVSVARRIRPEHLSSDTSCVLAGLTLDELAEVTPVITETIEGLYPDIFTQASLEVSSPGLSAPLLTAEQMRRHVSRLVAFALADGTSVTGRIVEVTLDHVRVQVNGADTREIPVTQIDRGDVQVEFSRPKDQE